jgi:hypothetical protein
MKNYTLYSNTHQGGEDYGCIQCVVNRRVAFDLLQSLAGQLQRQEDCEEDSDEIRMMLFGDLKTLQE